jgi:spore maturation protein CgeB
MADIVIVAHLAPGTSDAPLLLAKAFRRLGRSTEIFAMDENLPSAERVLDALALPHDHRAWMTLFNRRLRRRLRAVRPALLFLFGSNWKVAPDTLASARRSGTATALWECNHHLDAPFQREALRHYDCYFDLDSHFVGRARDAGVRRAEHLPGCADPDEHHRAALDTEAHDRYGAEVSFVGSPYPERIPLIDALGGYRLRLWGIGWDAAPLRGLGAGPAAVMREPVYGLKKTRIYCASAINLNVQGRRMVNGENFRLFEVAACEAFCLTTPKPDLGAWFRAGVDLETFTDAATLRAQVARFLAAPDERAERARAARRTVLAGHTYLHRARQVLDAVGLAPGASPEAAA